MFDHSSPFTPSLNVTINNMFRIIVITPKIKFDKEYRFTLPIPLDRALLNPNNMFDMINIMNMTAYS